MAYATKILPHYTYDDWVQWEGKWELQEGFPIAMSPAPLPRHQQVAASLQAELVFALKKCKKCFCYHPVDYKISEDTILVPDVLVVCGKIKKPFLDFPPALVVEVLSKSTALRDRNTKYTIYEDQGVKYYLIVDAERETMEVYDLIDSKYIVRNIQTNVYEFQFDNDCKITVDFSDIW
jgi:Uma2 family endonuclease